MHAHKPTTTRSRQRWKTPPTPPPTHTHRHLGMQAPCWATMMGVGAMHVLAQPSLTTPTKAAKPSHIGVQALQVVGEGVGVLDLIAPTSRPQTPSNRFSRALSPWRAGARGSRSASGCAGRPGSAGSRSWAPGGPPWQHTCSIPIQERRRWAKLLRTWAVRCLLRCTAGAPASQPRAFAAGADPTHCSIAWS